MSFVLYITNQGYFGRQLAKAADALVSCILGVDPANLVPRAIQGKSPGNEVGIQQQINTKI